MLRLENYQEFEAMLGYLMSTKPSWLCLGALWTEWSRQKTDFYSHEQSLFLHREEWFLNVSSHVWRKLRQDLGPHTDDNRRLFFRPIFNLRVAGNDSFHCKDGICQLYHSWDSLRELGPWGHHCIDWDSATEGSCAVQRLCCLLWL